MFLPCQNCLLQSPSSTQNLLLKPCTHRNKYKCVYFVCSLYMSFIHKNTLYNLLYLLRPLQLLCFTGEAVLLKNRTLSEDEDDFKRKTLLLCIV